MENLELLYTGKTKDVYRKKEGLLEFHFKDDATGYVDSETGKTVFDPGRDTVVGKKQGKGKLSAQISKYFFELLDKKGIPTHYVKTIEPNIMVAREAEFFHPQGYNLEFVFRNSAYGSFLRRYPVAEQFQNLHGLVEITTKGETDHLITEDALVELGFMNREEVKESKKLTGDINSILSAEFEKRGLYLIDGKVELGRVAEEGKISLIDDLSFDVMRICEMNEKEKGRILGEEEIIDKFGF